MAALGHMEHEASETPEEEAQEDDEDNEEEFEEVEVSDDDEGEGDEDTVDEYREVVPMGDGVTTTHDIDKDDDKTKKESLNESVSRKNKKYLNVLSEGMDSRRQTALESEIERMRRLAKLGNND